MRLSVFCLFLCIGLSISYQIKAVVFPSVTIYHNTPEPALNLYAGDTYTIQDDVEIRLRHKFFLFQGTLADAVTAGKVEQAVDPETQQTIYVTKAWASEVENPLLGELFLRDDKNVLATPTGDINNANTIWETAANYDLLVAGEVGEPGAEWETREYTTPSTMLVNNLDIGAQPSVNPVTFAPKEGANNISQLIFNVEYGCTLNINVRNNLLFVPSQAEIAAGPPAVHGIPLYVSFRGRGTTKFRIPSGKTVLFGPTAAEPNVYAGTRVTVVMEQYGQDAYTNNINQVLFEKWSYGTDEIAQENLDLTKDCNVVIGRRSCWVFGSHNYEGVSEWIDTNKDGVQANNELFTGIGTVAFDPTTAGTGRMVFHISGSSVPGDGFDGGFNLCGAYITPTGPNGTIANADIRDRIDFNVRAGIAARLRIVDNIAYNHYADSVDLSWNERGLSDRRGLMVISHNTTYPFLAANIEAAERVDLSKWAKSNEYQQGFVLGSNGEIQITHNTFLDYIADGDNGNLDAQYTTNNADKKRRNPAALIVDGLGMYALLSQGENDDFGDPIVDARYRGHLPEYDIHAKIILRGHAGLFVRGSIADPGTDELREEKYGLWLSHAENQQLFIPMGPYEDNVVKRYNPALRSVDRPAVDLEGNHALAIEGRLSVQSVLGPDDEPKDGFINVPSVLIDHSGLEITYGGDVSDLTRMVAAERPLVAGNWYPVYEQSAIFLNDDLFLENVRLVHNDVLREHGLRDVPVYPAIVGGDASSLAFNRGLWREMPQIHLLNATIECHESLVLAGVRLVVHENYFESGLSADNTSKILCYNRGFSLDNDGYGRTIALGSDYNLYQNGQTAGVLRDAFIHVFRDGPTQGLTENETNTIKLRLETVGEKLAGIPTTDTALHVFYMYGDSLITMGWPTLEADILYKPWNFEQSILDNLKLLDPANKDRYRFNPYATGTAHLEIAGDYLCFFGIDENLLPPLIPVTQLDVSGVIYVMHGGKLSVVDSHDVMFDTVIARHLAQTPAASGQIDMPNDQTIFLGNSALQPYGIHFNNFVNHIQIPGRTDTVTIVPPSYPDGFSPVR